MLDAPVSVLGPSSVSLGGPSGVYVSPESLPSMLPSFELEGISVLDRSVVASVGGTPGRAGTVSVATRVSDVSDAESRLAVVSDEAVEHALPSMAATTLRAKGISWYLRIEAP